MAYDCIQLARSRDPSSADSEPSYRESLRLEPISPPPNQSMEVSRLSGCKSSLMDNYDKYLNSLPQKQKEYHHLVMAARNSANYPLNKLSAPLILAKQQQSLIESQYYEHQIAWSQQTNDQRSDQRISNPTLNSVPLRLPSGHPLPAFGQSIQPQSCPSMTVHSLSQSGSSQVFQPMNPQPVHIQPKAYPQQSLYSVSHSVQHSVPHSLQPKANHLNMGSTSFSTNGSMVESNRHLLYSQPNLHSMSQMNQRLDSNQLKTRHQYIQSQPQQQQQQQQHNPLCAHCTDHCLPQNRFQRPFNDLNDSRHSSSLNEKWSQSLSQIPPKHRTVIMKASAAQIIPEMPSFPSIHSKKTSKTQMSPKRTVKQILDTSRNQNFPKLMTAIGPQPLSVAPSKAIPMTTAVTPTKRYLSRFPKFVPPVVKSDNNEILRSKLINNRSNDWSSVGLNVENIREMPLNLKISSIIGEEDDDCLVLSHFRPESQESQKVLSRNSSLSSDSIKLRISETPPLFKDIDDNKSQELVEKILNQMPIITDKREKCEENKQTSEQLKKSSDFEDQESEHEFERRLHLILDLLIAPKSGSQMKKSIEFEAFEPMIGNEWKKVFTYYEYDIEKQEFVRTLDLIRERDLKRKPIAYLNSRHPMNDISRSIYAGIATKKSVLDFPQPKRRLSSSDVCPSESKRRKRYSLWNNSNSSADKSMSDRKNEWSFVLSQLDFSSPLSQRVVGVLPQFQFR